MSDETALVHSKGNGLLVSETATNERQRLVESSRLAVEDRVVWLGEDQPRHRQSLLLAEAQHLFPVDFVLQHTVSVEKVRQVHLPQDVAQSVHAELVATFRGVCTRQHRIEAFAVSIQLRDAVTHRSSGRGESRAPGLWAVETLSRQICQFTNAAALKNARWSKQGF